MRISDWSSDVCSSDLGAMRFLTAVRPWSGRAATNQANPGSGGGSVSDTDNHTSITGPVCVRNSREAGTQGAHPPPAESALDRAVVDGPFLTLVLVQADPANAPPAHPQVTTGPNTTPDRPAERNSAARGTA